MLSLRSLAFILCSAIRRACALSCAALHSFPDIINGRKRRKMATNNARKMATAAPMCSLLRRVYTSQGDHGSGRKGPFVKRNLVRGLWTRLQWDNELACRSVVMEVFVN